MTGRRERARTLVGAVVHEMRVERITFLAGSVAYHAFVSILPLLLLVLLVVSAVGDRSLEAAVIAVARAAVTEGAADALVAELRRAGASRGVSAVGLGVLVWGTLRVFRGLDTAFSAVYETGGKNTFLDQLRDGVVVLFAFAFAVLAAAVVETTIEWGTGPLAWTLQRLGLVSGLVAALAPMYYVFPDTDVGVLEILPGTVFAAVGIAAAESLFGLYVAYSGQSPDASVVAALLVFLTWLYLSGLVVLAGAAVNAALSNRSADVSVDPLLGGVPRGEAAAPERAALLGALADVEPRLASAETVVVTVDGEATELPAPASASVDDGRGAFGAGPVVLELQWPAREE
jgi:membrane protein